MFFRETHFRREDFAFSLKIGSFGSKPGKLDQPFVGLGSTVAEEHLAGSDFGHQSLGKTDLLGNRKKVRAMNDLFRLLVDLLGPMRVTMTDVRHGDSACEVKKLFFV